MKFLTLKSSEEPALSNAIRRAAAAKNLTNVFNVSIAASEEQTCVTFRAESYPGEKPFRAYFGEMQQNGELNVFDMTDLTNEVEPLKTADPKLVTLKNELYVTFNTGHVRDGCNDIFLQRISPTRGPLQRCVFPQRRPIEKNWGFYVAPSGNLEVIYSLVPFIQLELVDGVLGATSTLSFEAKKSKHSFDGEFPRVHIGSQPIVDGDRVLLLANQQIKLPKIPRKTYVGRLTEIDLADGKLARISRTRLVHSWPAALLPQIKRHNPMLWSATYFSGLVAREGDLVLGYGINDRAFGVSRVKEAQVWS